MEGLESFQVVGAAGAQGSGVLRGIGSIVSQMDNMVHLKDPGPIGSLEGGQAITEFALAHCPEQGEVNNFGITLETGATRLGDLLGVWTAKD